MAGKANVLTLDQDTRKESAVIVRRLRQYRLDDTFGVGLYAVEPPTLECTSKLPLAAKLVATLMRRTRATVRVVQRPLARWVFYLLRLGWDEEEKAQ